MVYDESTRVISRRRFDSGRKQELPLSIFFLKRRTI
nr:MAG TPA: hypothetical protein [Caudoviricetes sp.]